MKITYFGHSAFQIVLNNGINILFDPFISENPFTKITPEELNPNFIVLTHAHQDHVGDAFEIARRADSIIITQTDFAGLISQKYHVKVIDYLNFGGSFYGNGFQMKMFPAWHTDARSINGQLVPVGVAAGFSLMAEGKLIYDAGDTGLFSDLRLVARKQPVDLAFLPIGGSFTMDSEDAAVAAEFLAAKQVIPIHYNTFMPIKADPFEFKKMLPDGVVKIPEIDQEFLF